MTDEAINVVLKEIARAERKFPLWPKDIIHASSIVSEESGELAKATVQYVYENGKLSNCLNEAIHTAATSIRFIKAYLDINQGYNAAQYSRSYEK